MAQVVGVETSQGRRPAVDLKGQDKLSVSRAVSEAVMDAMDCKCEGVLLKALDSVYCPGESGRSKSNWSAGFAACCCRAVEHSPALSGAALTSTCVRCRVKVKPDYIDAPGDHLELTILGELFFCFEQKHTEIINLELHW